MTMIGTIGGEQREISKREKWRDVDGTEGLSTTKMLNGAWSPDSTITKRTLIRETSPPQAEYAGTISFGQTPDFVKREAEASTCIRTPLTNSPSPLTDNNHRTP